MMEKRVSPLRLLLRAAETVLICAVLGYLLLVLCYALSDPVRQEKNVSSSALTLAYEDVCPTEPFSQRLLDNYTDSLMLLISSHANDESAFVRAEEDEYWTYHGNGAYDSLDWIYNQGEEPTGTNTYQRYWHGYQLTLRLLLHVMDYRQIRKLNGVLQILLLALTALLL